MKSFQYVDTSFEPLSNEHRYFYSSFFQKVETYSHNKNILLLYRGTMYSNIQERLDNSDLNENNIFNRAFYFGEKARFCSNEKIKDTMQVLFKDINDCSFSTLKKVFDEIESLLSEQRLRLQVKSRLSPSFKRYFKRPENRNLFASIINNIECSKTKLLLRDYYLYLLHTGYTIKYHTPLVSTSIKRSEAKNFKKMKNKDEKIIFHYFVPEALTNSIIAPWKISTILEVVSTYKLPHYIPEGLFPKQKEITVKGGLFPQFILGIELVDKEQFIVNPYLINYTSSDFDNILKVGILFDQSDFGNKILKTNYAYSTLMNDSGYVSSKPIS